MKILFVNKGSLEEVSGGFIYNKTVIDYGRRIGYQIDYSNSIADTDYDFFIIDSLFLNQSGPLMSCLFDKTILLIHQLPKELFHLNGVPLIQTEKNQLKYIVTSEAIKTAIITHWGVIAERIKVITPGVNSGWKQKKELAPRIANLLMIANYVPNKGYQQLTDLIGLFNHWDLRLHCFGNSNLDTDFFRQVHQQIKALDTEDRITLNDSITQNALNQQMLASDLLISLSTSETFGMAINESIAARLPVLMYRTGNWQAFEKTGMVRVVNNHDLNEFMNTLEQLIRTENYFSIASPHQVAKTWETVGREFFTACANWIKK